MNTTYKGIAKLLAQYLAADQRVHSVRSMDEWRGDTKRNDLLPIVIYDLNRTELSQNGITRGVTIALDLVCLDQLRDDRTNIDDIISETDDILRSLCIRLMHDSSLEDLGINVTTTTVTNTQAQDRTDDKSIGTKCTISFDIPLELCGSSLPNLPIGVYSNVYTTEGLSPLCAALLSCSVIQNIQNDIAYLNSVTGGTGSQDLQSVTTVGNITSNDIKLSATTISPFISFDTGSGLFNSGLLHAELNNSRSELHIESDEISFISNVDDALFNFKSVASSFGADLQIALSHPISIGAYNYADIIFRNKNANVYYSGTLSSDLVRTQQTWHLPDDTGTLALTKNISYVNPGLNITTGGTATSQIVSVVDSPTFTGVTATSVFAVNLSGSTIYSGNSDLSDLIGTIVNNSVINNLYSSTTVYFGGNVEIANNLTVSGLTVFLNGLQLGTEVDANLVLYLDRNTSQITGSTFLTYNPLLKTLYATNQDVSQAFYPRYIAKDRITYIGGSDVLTGSSKMRYVESANTMHIDAIVYSGNTLLSDLIGTGGSGGTPTYVQAGVNVYTGGTASSPIVGVIGSPTFTAITVNTNVYADYVNANTFQTSGGIRIDPMPDNAILFCSGSGAIDGTNLYTYNSVTQKQTVNKLEATTVTATTYYSGTTQLNHILSSIGGGGTPTYVQAGVNVYTGGTPSSPIIGVIGSPTFTGVTASSISGTSVSATTFYSGSTNLNHLLGGAASTTQTAYLSSSFTTSSASYVNVTGLSVTLDANSTYSVSIMGCYQSTNTGTGAMVSLTRTGSPTVCNFERRLYSAAATSTMLGSVGNADDVGAAGTTVDIANVDRAWNMHGIVVTSASPCVLQVRAIRVGSANNISIRQGSTIIANKVS